MDRKIILPLLVASAVIGGLSDHITEDGDSFYPGFLLYLPGNLRAGSAATAYIEANFTDPFEARLTFMHSNPERNFHREARIVNGSGGVEFEVPDGSFWSGRVIFTGTLEGSRQAFTSFEIVDMEIHQQHQKVTFIETDKPLYTPGQEVKFRLLTIDSQFKPETSKIPRIQIESPSQIKLAQWRDVERPEGLVDLSFQLISEPALGEYKIKAYINDASVTQTFTVDKYVLPKVEVTINVPSFVLISAQEYSFQVCAKYTYGQPVRGFVFGDVGKLRNKRGYFPYGVGNFETLSFSGHLDGEGCLETSVSGLYLTLNHDTPYYTHSLEVRATVVEDTTRDVFSEVSDATIIKRYPIDIALASPEVFKPGIPYHCRIKVTYPDGKPAPNETLNILARVDYRKTVYNEDHTANSDGIAEFAIQFPVTEKSISFQVEAKNYPYQNLRHGYTMYPPTMYRTLNPNYSPTGRYLQITPIYDSVNSGEELSIQVLYTSDDDVVSSDFKFQFVSRNNLVDAGATPKGDSRRRRAVVSDDSEEEDPTEVPIGESRAPVGSILCPYGFKFADDGNGCVGETECERQLREVTENVLMGAWTPVCDEDGNFMSKQCSSDYCWCVDTVSGLEIPGTITGNSEDNIHCEVFVHPCPEGYEYREKNSTRFCVTTTKCNEGFKYVADSDSCVRETECERQVREVTGNISLGTHTPVCDEDGNFMPEQCSSDYCWCVDIVTGVKFRGTQRGPTQRKIHCKAPIVHVDPQALNEVSFTVPIAAGISPQAGLLVHYTSPEGEVVADSINLNINREFENKVKLKFLDPEVLPGSETTLKVSAENGSLCGIGIVDKSVYVLGGKNKVTPKKLLSTTDFSVPRVSNRRACPNDIYHDYLYYSDSFPEFGESVTFFDSSSAFSSAGLRTFTNYDLSVAPCFMRSRIATILSHRTLDHSSKANEEKIRSYFPETWLWTLIPVRNGEVEVPLTVPHTITDWIANGLCTNVDKGVGASPPVVLRAFQPFFLSMSLPFSVIREEKTPIKVSVFNYFGQCLVVRVTLEENESFTLSGPNEHTVVVPAGDVTTMTYKIAAFVLGSIPLQVSAESISDDEFLCGNQTAAGPAGSSDAVRRDLRVKPEGEPETTTESAYFCLKENETYSKQISLKIPPQHVHGSAVGEISVTGDLVGNTLGNVESMLRMPYGCGEQNLLSMVPNIVALQYLESVREATPEITAEAKKYILIGYQRELNYRRSDNSYAAFGDSNPSGSTFLTAFVVRTYAHAQMFVDVDEEDLNVTVQWLRSIQNADGSFRSVGYLAHKSMKGGVNNNITLAAYMVATFLEAGYDSQDETVAAALAYLDSKLDTLKDTYSMALLAYAYALAGSDRFDVVYEMLQDLAVESEGMKHWESNREDLPAYTAYYRDSSRAQNIEMTAYVLRAMVVKRVPNVEEEGRLIARWLVSKRNPRGGFSSTQDTVIGLTALAEFSSLSTSEISHLTLTMNILGGSTLQFNVDYYNRFIIQRGSFESFPAEISVTAEGQGCALYSISGDYYIHKEKQRLDPFTLDVKAKLQNPKSRKRRNAYGDEEHEYDEEETACDKFTISVSARYNGEDGASNMAIINFRPVSGFVFDKESLKAMLKRYKFVKRYEINEDIITFYFDELTNEEVEFEFNVIKEFDVENAKPAFMSILDYYENGLKVAEEFKFVCADDVSTSSPSTSHTTPPSPSGFASSSSTETPDYDECAIPDVCGGPEFQCVNYIGTYECICAEGYALDEDEENCVEVPSCPVCYEGELPPGFFDLICVSDLIRVMKVRGDGSLRSLYDVVNKVDIQGRIYYDVEINEDCTCDLIASGERIILVASSDNVGRSTGRNKERVLLNEEVVIVPSIRPIKKEIAKILGLC